MKKLILFIIILNSALFLQAQNIFDHTGKIRMRYSSDTITQQFNADTVLWQSVTNPFYRFQGGLMADSIRLDYGEWINAFNASQWTTTGSDIYYNTGNVGINNATPSYKLDVNGLIGGSNIETNTTSLSTKLGYEAGNSEDETAARYNVFIGYKSGYSNVTDGVYNNFLGYESGYSNTEGAGNVFLGYKSGYSNTDASNNIFLGYESGYSNTEGTSNLFIGYKSGYSNVLSGGNTYLGASSGLNNTSGSGNIAVGLYSGAYNTLSNRLFINNSNRSNIAGDTTKSIIYGYMDSDETLQRLTINANTMVNGHLTRVFYGAAAYVPDDSTLTTNASTTWTFVGAGANNKFANIYTNGFAFDGDTLYFNQETSDTRDSVCFTLGWSTSSSSSVVNKIVSYGIFTKRVGESTYTEKPWLTMTNKLAAAGDLYSWGCVPVPIYLTDGEKIQIRVKVAATTSTITTEDFVTCLKEN